MVSMMKNKTQEVAQLSFLDGLPVKEKTAETRRIRMTLDDDTLGMLDEIMQVHEKKYNKKGNWYPKDTFKLMIQNEYKLIKSFGENYSDPNA